VSIRVELRETLSCETCGDPFEVSARYARGIRRGVYPLKCSPCARGARCKPYDELRSLQAQNHRGPVTDRERRWCLEHYTDEEILFYAEAFTGERGDIDAIRAARAYFEAAPSAEIVTAA
jgi:hypothetical protein